MFESSMKTRQILASISLLAATPLMAGTQYTVVGNATSAGANTARGKLVYSGGYLFGTSQFGGTSGKGTVFRFDPAMGSYQVNHSFDGANGGQNPGGGLIKANDNRFYTATYGGMNGQGTLFRIDQPGNFPETIRQFQAGTTGGNPDSAPTQASDGKLYGVTGTGGDNGFGGIYQSNLDGTGYTLLRSFTGTTGGTRGKGSFNGGLVEGPGGMLYGCTHMGGNAGDTGLFFATSTNGITYNFFHAFDAPGLTKPCNQLLLASDGFFYGATEEGGAANRGGLFRIAPGGDYTELRSFSNNLDGFAVYSPLIEGSDGYLYGCAFYSSNNLGSVFRMSKDGKGFTVLHRFAGGLADGSQPDSALVETSNGVFYGTTTSDGANGVGIVYKIETTLEAPTLKVKGTLRPKFRGNSLRLRGTASDDLSGVRVEYATKKAYKPAKGTTAWRARIPVKPTTRRVTVRVRAVDTDALASPITTIRARRSK